MHSSKFLLYSTILLLTCYGSAQTVIEPEFLTIEDGLSQGFVSVIHQDQEGFLWLGTKNGLNRYDGEHFEVFAYNPDDPHSITNDWIQCIYEDGDFLILGTHSEYLNLFHKKTKRNYRLPLKVGAVEPFRNVSDIHKDEAGIYWISTLNKELLLKITFPNDFWTQIPQDTTLLDQVKIELVLNGAGHYWNLEKSFVILPDTDKFKKLDKQSLKISTFPNSSPYSKYPLFNKVTDEIAIGPAFAPSTTNPYKLYKFQEDQWQTIHSKMNFNWRHFYDYQTNILWLQPYNNYKLLGFDLDLIHKVDELKEENATYIIDHLRASVQSYFKDRSGILWIGTSGFGVVKISPRKLAIKNYWPDESIYNDVYSSSEGELWYYKYNTANYYQSGKKSSLKLVNPIVESLRPTQVDWINDGPNKGWLVIADELEVNHKELELTLYYNNGVVLRKETQIRLPYFWNSSELSLLKSPDHHIIHFVLQFFDPIQSC